MGQSSTPVYNLVVEGQIEGTVQVLKNQVVVDGTVLGDLYVAAAQINGRVIGSIIATESVGLGATAVCEGNMVAPQISLTDGARFKGSIETRQPTGFPESVQNQPMDSKTD